MKLSNVVKIVKNNAVKVLATAALAGVALTAAAPAAQAQRFFVGVHVGGPAFYGPRYVAPPVVVYGHPGFYGYGYGYHHDWRYDHRFDHRGWR